MFDKFSVTDKSVLESIPLLIKETGSKTEAFNQLKENLPSYQHNSLARRIAAYTSEEIRSKNKLPVYMLITSLIVWYITHLLSFFLNPLNNDLLRMPVIIISIILLTIVEGLWLYGFIRFKLFAYTTAISLGSLNIISVFIYLLYKINGFTIFDLISLCIGLIFLQLLRNAIFPEINFWGNVRSDKTYKYIFCT